MSKTKAVVTGSTVIALVMAMFIFTGCVNVTTQPTPAPTATATPTPIPTPEVDMQLSKAELEQELQAASNDLNATLPRKVDDNTTILSTSVSNTDLTYNYQVNVSEKKTQADVDSDIKPGLTNDVCNTSETRDLLDMGAGLIYKYYDANNDYIGEVVIHLSDCQ